MLLGLLLFALLPLAAGANALEFACDLIFQDASATSLGLFSLGLSALLQSFFLGLAIRLIGPSLPR